MNIPAVAPYVYTGLKAIVILPKSENNIGRKYIYNEALDITKKLRVPATFHTNKIEFPTPTQAVISKLDELGISFDRVV